MHTIKWGWAYLRKKITVNMPPLKSSLIKPSKSMLFFHIWNANFSVTPINSHMYMTKPKQVQKKTLRTYWENFFRNYALFYMQGGAYLRKLQYCQFCHPDPQLHAKTLSESSSVYSCSIPNHGRCSLARSITRLQDFLPQKVHVAKCLWRDCFHLWLVWVGFLLYL